MDCRSPILDRDFDYAEVQTTLNKPKSHKAPGPDAMENKFDKFLPEKWKWYMLRMFNHALRTGKTPNNWEKFTEIMFFKKEEACLLYR